MEYKIKKYTNIFYMYNVYIFLDVGKYILEVVSSVFNFGAGSPHLTPAL